MINNSFKEYLENVHNKNSNYKQILSKEKGVRNMRRKILNVAAIFLVIILTGVISTQIYAKIKWNIEFKEYKNLPSAETKGTLKEIKEDGFSEILDVDYLTQDGIGIKLNSILLTDDCLDMDVTFKFDKNLEVNSQTFSSGFTIYDENKNIYSIHSRMHIGENTKYDNVTLFTYKELGVKYNKKDVYAIQLASSSGITQGDVDEENRTINMNITLRAKDKFPQSKKLYIRLFDPGFSMIESENNNNENKIVNAEDFSLSDAKWIFEIDVPDKFYERNSVELKPENEISGIEFKNITITDTGLNLVFKSEEYDKLIKDGKDMDSSEFLEKVQRMLYISDKDGNRYNELNIGSPENDQQYKMTLDVGLKYLDDLYINYNNQKEKLIEK